MVCGVGSPSLGIPAARANIDLTKYTAIPATSVFSRNGILKREYRSVIDVALIMFPDGKKKPLPKRQAATSLSGSSILFPSPAFSFNDVVIQPNLMYRVSLPTGVSPVIPGSAISRNPSHPATVLVSFRGSIYPVSSVQLVSPQRGPGSPGSLGSPGSPGRISPRPPGSFSPGGNRGPATQVSGPGSVSVSVKGPGSPGSPVGLVGRPISHASVGGIPRSPGVISPSGNGGVYGPGAGTGPGTGPSLDIEIYGRPGSGTGAGDPSGFSSAGVGGAGGFHFNGIFITAGGSYSVTFPNGATIIVSGSAISPNPSNPGSVLVSYGGSVHVVFVVSPAGGAGPSSGAGVISPSGATGLYGPGPGTGPGTGPSIDIDIHAGHQSGAGTGVAPGAGVGVAEGFYFNGIFISAKGYYSVTLPNGATIIVSGSAISPNPSNPGSVLISYGGSVHVVFVVSPAGGTGPSSGAGVISQPGNGGVYGPGTDIGPRTGPSIDIDIYTGRQSGAGVGVSSGDGAIVGRATGCYRHSSVAPDSIGLHGPTHTGPSSPAGLHGPWPTNTFGPGSGSSPYGPGPGTGQSIDIDIHTGRQSGAGTGASTGAGVGGAGEFYFNGILISAGGSYSVTFLNGATVIVSGSAISPNPSNPGSVLVSYGGSVHVVFIVSPAGGAGPSSGAGVISPSGATGLYGPGTGNGPSIDIDIHTGRQGGTGTGVAPGAGVGGAERFYFNGIFISAGSSYSVTLPKGATVIVPGSAISPNPSNPGSVLVSYGGSVHVVFIVSPAGGAGPSSGAGVISPSGAGEISQPGNGGVYGSGTGLGSGTGPSIDIDIHTGHQIGAGVGVPSGDGTIVGRATGCYRHSSVAPDSIGPHIHGPTYTGPSSPAGPRGPWPTNTFGPGSYEPVDGTGPGAGPSIDIDIHTGRQGDTGCGVTPGAGVEGAVRFHFNGILISAKGSYSVTLPNGATIIVSGSAISPNPSNPGSVLVSYGGSVHVVFVVSPAGGTGPSSGAGVISPSGATGLYGPGPGTGPSIDIDIHTGRPSGAGVGVPSGVGAIVGRATGCYRPSSVAPDSTGLHGPTHTGPSSPAGLHGPRPTNTFGPGSACSPYGPVDGTGAGVGPSIDIDIHTGRQGGTGTGVASGAGVGGAEGFYFNGILISAKGSYSVTLPYGAPVIVSGSAISPNPGNPGSVLVSYGGSVHVVFVVSPAGGAGPSSGAGVISPSAATGLYGPGTGTGPGTGPSIDIDIHTGRQIGAGVGVPSGDGAIVGKATGCYRHSSVAPDSIGLHGPTYTGPSSPAGPRGPWPINTFGPGSGSSPYGPCDGTNPGVGPSIDIDIHTGRQGDTGSGVSPGAGVEAAGGFYFKGILISAGGFYSVTLPNGATIIVSGSAISPNPSNPGSVLVSYGGSVHVVFIVSPAGGAGPSSGAGVISPSGAGVISQPGNGGVYGPDTGPRTGPSIDIDNDIHTGRQSGAGVGVPSGAGALVGKATGCYRPSSVAPDSTGLHDPTHTGPSSPAGLHGPWPTNTFGPGSGSSPYGPVDGTGLGVGPSIDIDIHTGRQGGTGTGVAPGAGVGGAEGFYFNGIFISAGGSYSVTLPNGATVIVSGYAISPNPSNPGSVLVSYGGSVHVVFVVSPAGGAGPSSGAGVISPSGATGLYGPGTVTGPSIDIDIHTGRQGGTGAGVTSGAGSGLGLYGPGSAGLIAPGVLPSPTGAYIPYPTAGHAAFLSPGSPGYVSSDPSSSSDDSSSSEEDSPNKLPYPTYPAMSVPKFMTGGLPQRTRSFPLFVMFNPDGSVKTNYQSVTKDKRPIVVIPASMMNRPSRRPTDFPTCNIAGTTVYPDRFYQVTIGGNKAVVPGRYFRSRKTRPGTFSVKINGQRIKVPAGISLSEVSFSFSTRSSGSVPSGCNLIAFPASGAEPRGYQAVCSIGGKEVTVDRKNMRLSNTRPGQMVVKHGNTTHLVPANAVKMQACQ